MKIKRRIAELEKAINIKTEPDLSVLTDEELDYLIENYLDKSKRDELLPLLKKVGME